MPNWDAEAMGFGDFHILDRNGRGVRDDIGTVDKSGIMPNCDSDACTTQLRNHSGIVKIRASDPVPHLDKQQRDGTHARTANAHHMTMKW
jgi:hypothetical protein